MSQGKPSLLQRIKGWLGFGDSQPTSKTTGQKKQSSRPKSQGERQQQPVTSPKLFIGNLSYSVDDKQLKKLFETVGNVEKAEVVMHRKTQRSKGFGFVTMANKADAETAAAKLDGKEIDGRPIGVSGAKTDNNRPSAKKKSSSKKSSSKKTASNRGPRQNDEGGRSNRGPKGRGKGKGGGKSRIAESTVTPMVVPEVMSAKLVIKNIDDSFSESELEGLFAGVATISESTIEDGKVLVEMKSVDAAQEAVRLLDGKDFMGKTLSVTEA